MPSRPPIRRGMLQAGALLKKSLVKSHVRSPVASREARKLVEHITYQIVWVFSNLDYKRHDLGTATCPFADSSSEQGKSETLRLGLHIMSNVIFCPKCRTKLVRCPSKNRQTKNLPASPRLQYTKRQLCCITQEIKNPS